MVGKPNEPKASAHVEIDPFADVFPDEPDVQLFAGTEGRPNVFRGRFEYQSGTTPGGVIYREMRVDADQKEVQTQEQLESYARRMLSNAVKDSLVMGIDVDGHSINGVNITPDTIVSINDAIGGVFGDLWIAERTFSYREKKQTTSFTAYRPASITL